MRRFLLLYILPLIAFGSILFLFSESELVLAYQLVISLGFAYFFLVENPKGKYRLPLVIGFFLIPAASNSYYWYSEDFEILIQILSWLPSTLVISLFTLRIFHKQEKSIRDIISLLAVVQLSVLSILYPDFMPVPILFLLYAYMFHKSKDTKHSYLFKNSLILISVLLLSLNIYSANQTYEELQIHYKNNEQNNKELIKIRSEKAKIETKNDLLEIKNEILNLRIDSLKIELEKAK